MLHKRDELTEPTVVPTTKLPPTNIGGMPSYVVGMLGTVVRMRGIATADDIDPWGLTVPAVLVPARGTCAVERGQPKPLDWREITKRHVKKRFKWMAEYSQVMCWHPPFFSVGLAQAGLGQGLVLEVKYASFATVSARLI